MLGRLSMKAEFATVLDAFNAAQLHAVKILEGYGIPIPKSNLDWTILKLEPEIKSKMSSDGIHIFKHGYGLTIKDSTCYIDFDFGKNGEVNGFDVHRLFFFIEKNNIPSRYKTVDEIKCDFKEALEAGEIFFSGYINHYKAVT